MKNNKERGNSPLLFLSTLFFTDPLKWFTILFLIHKLPVVQISLGPPVYPVIVDLTSVLNLAVTVPVAIRFVCCQYYSPSLWKLILLDKRK